MDPLKGIAALLVVLIKSRASLAAENLALRQQLAVLMRSMKRPKLRRRDRLFWAWLSRFWPGWRTVLVIVEPETVIRWHRQGFRLYGAGDRERKAVARSSMSRFDSSSVACPEKIRPGEHQESAPNSTSSVTMSPSRPSRST